MAEMNVEATLKSKDTEETLDILFYRPLGFILAKFCEKTGISPNTVTWTSIVLGGIAGHAFYYSDLQINILGMLLLIFANLLDSTDGQLARMTNQCTRMGRFLDGFGGNVWFTSIYIHIGLRMINEGYEPWIFGFVIVTGLFHSFQAAMADYYRNAHLFFIQGKNKSEVDSSKKLEHQYQAASWSGEFWTKVFLFMYTNYTKEQEILSKNLQKLYDKVSEKYPTGAPEWLVANFRKGSKPLMKYTNILTTNTRMWALFFSMFFGEVIWYLVFEITVLNILLIQMVVRQERLSKKMILEIEQA